MFLTGLEVKTWCFTACSPPQTDPGPPVQTPVLPHGVDLNPNVLCIFTPLCTCWFLLSDAFSFICLVDSYPPRSVSDVTFSCHLPALSEQGAGNSIMFKNTGLGLNSSSITFDLCEQVVNLSAPSFHSGTYLIG